jgi:hypothetical protein
MPVRFQLTYAEEAEQTLAALWLDPPFGTTPTDAQWAADQLEKDLKTDAHRKGVADPDDDGPVRRLVVYPLAVYFRLSENDRRVVVLRFEATARII